MFEFIKRLSPTSLALIALLALGSISVQADTLDVHYPDNPGDFDPDDWTGSDVPGSFFDLTSTEDLVITGFSAYSAAAIVGEPGDPFSIEIWAKKGTYVGSETTPDAWTLVETISGTDPNDDVMELLNLSKNFILPAGQVTGFAIMGSVGGIQWYDVCNGSDSYTEGPLTLDIIDVRGADDRFVDDDNCRSFAGMVHFGIDVPSEARAIPTLSFYSLLLLALTLGAFGVYRHRKIS